MAREKAKIKVRPVDGRRVMLHDNPTRAITEERVVVDHPHYRRAVKRGDLELVAPSAEPVKSKKKEG